MTQARHDNVGVAEDDDRWPRPVTAAIPRGCHLADENCQARAPRANQHMAVREQEDVLHRCDASVLAVLHLLSHVLHVRAGAL